MVIIDRTLDVIKRDPRAFLDGKQILQLCHQHGYHPDADGKLDPPTLIALFMQQVACGNVSCDEVSLMEQGRFTASGYCQARMRLPLGVIQDLTRQMCDRLAEPIDQLRDHRWHSHRVLLMDSSSFSMSDTPQLQAYFGQPQKKKGVGFPVAHVLMLFNARTGLALDAITAPLRTHEMSIAAQSHQRMHARDLVLGDDSFGAYAHFALLTQRGLEGLFPLHHKRIADFTPHRPFIEPGNKIQDKGLPRSRWVKSLGHDDQIVEWFKPRQKPDWMSAPEWKSLPGTLLLREVRRTTTRPGFRAITLTIVTTLLDPVKYPADELFALRLRRWDVETDLRHLKTTMKMEVLRCMTVEGVNKELWMFLMVYNLVRAIMVQAAKRQKVSVSRISFASALHWMRWARPGDTLPLLAIVPYRPNRLEPRALKRRAKPYDLLIRPRAQMREEARKSRGFGT